MSTTSTDSAVAVPTFEAPRPATPLDGAPLWLAVLVGALLGAGTLWLPFAVATALFAAPFVVAAVIDVMTRRIPDALSAAALALALAAAILAGHGIDATLGSLAALTAGFALHVAARGAFGLGDVKLMAGAGAVAGLAQVLDFLLAMAFAGGALALLLLALHPSYRGRHATMPYGPAIAAGIVLVLLVTR